jgi:hypothetical protein
MARISLFATIVAAVFLTSFTFARAADPQQSGTGKDSASKSDKDFARPNLLIIGASSLNSPVGQTQLVGAMLKSQKIEMNVVGAYPKLDAVAETLRAKKQWDYVVLDAWHLGRSRKDWGTGSAAVPAEFAKATAQFVKEVRTHSPKCKIILFPWWIPSGSKASKEGAMEVFRSCVEQAKANDIWVATTGPAFMEAFFERPNLKIVKSKTDGHPGVDGAYLIACSLFEIIADKSPVGLPARLELEGTDGKKTEYVVSPEDAKYLQEFAWKVYQREIKQTKPGK